MVGILLGSVFIWTSPENPRLLLLLRGMCHLLSVTLFSVSLPYPEPIIPNGLEELVPLNSTAKEEKAL